jgi:hypothetical protein
MTAVSAADYSGCTLINLGLREMNKIHFLVQEWCRYTPMFRVGSRFSGDFVRGKSRSYRWIDTSRTRCAVDIHLLIRRLIPLIHLR